MTVAELYEQIKNYPLRRLPKCGTVNPIANDRHEAQEAWDTDHTGRRKKRITIPRARRSSMRSWSEFGPAILTVSVVQPFPIAIGSHLEGLERE